MSTQAGSIPTPPTSVVRNIVGKGNEQTLENPNMHLSDATLQEYCDMHYHRLLPLIAEKHSESRTPNTRGEHGGRRKSRRSHSTSQSPETTPSVFFRIRRDGPESPRHRDSEKEAMFTRLGRKEKGIFNRLGGKERSVFAFSSDSKPQRHWNTQREAKSRY
nr:hypothetical protein [Tanacetum cinerariifolium]